MVRNEVFISSFLLVKSRSLRAYSEIAVKINSKGNNHHKTSKDDKFSKVSFSFIHPSFLPKKSPLNLLNSLLKVLNPLHLPIGTPKNPSKTFILA